MKTIVVVVFFVMQLLAAAVCLAQSGLSLGAPVTRRLEIDEQHVYAVDLQAGEFALFLLGQKGIDVAIETYAADGELIERFDSPNGSFEDEFALLDAREAGIYQLKICPLKENRKEKAGEYVLEFLSAEKEVAAHLDAVFGALGDRLAIPGFVVGITDARQTRYRNAQGFANLQAEIPYSDTTIQQIESISKTFIGLSLMLLVEQGKLDLDTDINVYLPFKVVNPYSPGTPITLRHLATHTAGINDGKNYNKAYWLENKEVLARNTYAHKAIWKDLEAMARNTPMTAEEFLRGFFEPKGRFYRKQNFFKRPSGTEWYYSNVGGALAAYIVEVVSGQDYADFVRTHIFQPLGLSTATWGYDPERARQTALKYGAGQAEYPRARGATYAEGGVYMSAADLNRYLQHWIRGCAGEGGLLKAESYAEITRVWHEEGQGRFKGLRMGLFWWHMQGGRMGHNGGSLGVSANMYFYPELGVGYTSFENMMRGEEDAATVQSRWLRKVLERYVGEFVEAR